MTRKQAGEGGRGCIALACGRPRGTRRGLLCGLEGSVSAVPPALENLDFHVDIIKILRFKNNETVTEISYRQKRSVH